MVHLVCFPNGHEIGILCAAKPLETLVDENVVNQKIGQAVRGNPRADPHAKVTSRHGPRDETPRARNGENQKERIVFLKKARFMNVVVGMKKPHDAMHEVFVGKPRHTLHSDESADDDACG